VLSRRSAVRAVAALWLSLGAVAEADASRVWVNGVQFELRYLVLAGDPASLARALDGRWGERQGRAPGRSSEPWQAQSSREILGRQRGPFHETLTLLPGPRQGSSRVLVAVHDLRVPPAAIPPAPLPVPVAARLVNVVQFDASANASAVFTIDTPGTPAGALREFRRAALARGWQAVAAPPMSTVPGAAIWARRGHREMTIVATPAGRRVRLVLLVTRDDTGRRR